MELKRSHYIGNLNALMKGNKVIVGGWVEDLRELGKLAFLTLRDVTGVAQVVIAGTEKILQVKDLSRQSVVRVTGIIQETKASDFSYEIRSEIIEILVCAVHTLPIDSIVKLKV